MDKVKSLETVVAEHEQVKRDVQLMRDLMEQRKREMDAVLVSTSTLQPNRANSHNPPLTNGKRPVDDGHDEDSDDDDRRSVITVIPEDNESRPHDGYSQEDRDRDDDEDRRARSEAMRRPRTPEPHGLDEDDEDAGVNLHQLRPQFDSTSLMPPSSNEFSSHAYSSQPQQTIRKLQPVQNGHITTTDLHSQNVLLSTRLETLTSQLDTALDLSRKLQSQAEAAQSNIERLQAKVESLEAFVEKTRTQQQQQLGESNGVDEVQDRPSVSTEVWDAWRGGMEGEWRVEREEWETERRRLKDAVREWEGRMDELEGRERERAAEEKEILAAIRRERETEEDNWDHRGDDDDEDDEHSSPIHPPDLRPQINGILNHGTSAKQRIAGSSKSSKLRKRRSSQVAPVATPPHSPTLNGDTLEQSSEASGSRPTSPTSALSSHVKGMASEVFGNGHALAHAKRGMLPLSPAPSVRYGTRAGSTESEPEVLDEGNNETDDQVRPETSGLEKPYVIRHAQMGDSVSHHFCSHLLTVSLTLAFQPLPYISAAGVVFIGLAAWAVVATRLKD